MQDRQAETLADETIARRRARAPVRRFRHALAERGQLLLCLLLEGDARARVNRRTRDLEQLLVQRGQSCDGLPSRLTANAVRRRAGGVELLSQAIDHRVGFGADRPGRTRRGQPQRRPLEVQRQRGRAETRRAPRVRRPAAWPAPTARRHSSKTSRTSASQKSIRTGRRRGPLR